MASNPNSDAVFTPGKVNFIKVSELLQGLGRTIIRELFDLQVPPANLAAQLQALRSTRPMSIWTRDENKILFPSTGATVSSTSFDISLLCKLFREIGNLAPHRWDQPLDPSDHSLAAEIRRVKDYRNKLVHQGTMELDDHQFNTYWNDIKAILLGIVRLTPPQQTADDRVRKWETAIDKLYAKHIIEIDREWARQLLEFTEVIIEFTTTLASSGAWLLGNERILNRYNSEPDILTVLVQEAALPLGMKIFGFLTGSVKIVIWTREPKALEEFWRRYQTGQLREDLEKVLITEELKQLANGDAVELQVTVSEQEYQRAHEYLTGEDKEDLKKIGAAAKSEKLPEDTISSLGAVSEGKKMPTKVGNFIRLARLLTCVGAKALRGLFDSRIAPKDLVKKLNEPYVLNTLRGLKAKGLLTPHQIKLLYPPSIGVVESKSFNITLLIKLLTLEKICGIAPPATGWNDLPRSKDTSLEADLARIKYYRHKLILEHMDNGLEVSHGDFKDYWDNIKGTILRIVRHYSDPSVVAVWEEDINHCLTGQLSDVVEMDLQKQTEPLKAPERSTFPATKGDETAKEEEELAHRFQETKLTSDFDLVTFDGDIFEDRENKFQAHLAVITSEDQVEQVLLELKKKDPDVAEATHNIWAYRIFDDEKHRYNENCDDDGDDTSGARVLRFLQRTEVTDVMVVVSCWYKTTADDLGPVRFTYIQKSVLDLILACGIVELQTSKIKIYFEEIKYTPFEKVKEQETPKFKILHGQPIEDRKSTFQGHLAEITSREQVDQVLAELKKDRKTAKATYNMWACRIYDEKKKYHLEDSNDGEHQGGDRILHLLRRSDAKNVVVIVTRWHGGIHLGTDRFKHINKCASDLLQQRK